MARTSKTVIGGGEGRQADRMLAAADSGNAARQRAHAQLMATEQGVQQQTMQGAGMVLGAEQQARQEQIQQQQFDRTASQRDDALDLEAAKSGFERGGDDRSAQLEAEMERGQGQPKLGPLDSESQQRLSDQGKQPMEMDSSGRWRPTKERTENMAREQRREDFKADTERVRALAYREQVGVSAQRAYAKGDMEQYEADAKKAASFANSSQQLYDRIKKGEIEDDDWAGLESEAMGSEQADPSLMQALKSRDIASPRVQQFLRAKVQFDALSSIASTGSDEFLKVDWTMPKMREFLAARNAINDFNRANPALSQTALIRNTQDKMRFINMTAAFQVMMGMTRAPSPTGGMMPATQAPGQPQAPQAGGEEPMVPPGGTQVPLRDEGAQAVRDARAGGASPSEALQAGQRRNPTAREDRQVPSRMNQSLGM